MKKYVVTAAALMLGTSALAWAPAEKAHVGAIETAKTAFSADTLSGSANWSKEDKLGMTSLAKSSEASVPAASASTGSKVADDGGVTFAEADFKAKADVDSTAMASTSSTTKVADDGGVTFAESDFKAKGDIDATALASASKVADDGGLTFAEADIKSKDDVGGIQTASATDTGLKSPDTGMGGPVESAATYPPCDPGPGDDRCIQLYEPGVRTALAAWKDANSNVGMGGPLEPAPSGTKEQASAQQATTGGSASAHSGHDMSAGTHAKTTTGTADADTASDTGAAMAKPATGSATTGTTPGAIGGPVEQRTGYPPCRPGRGDDRCIQLYERGVTGRDN